MNTNAVIRDCLKEIVLGDENFLNIPHSYYAEVSAVNEKARTCDVKLLNGRAELDVTDVQLMATIQDGLLQIPSIGSTVVVCNTPNMQPYVGLFSNLDKVIMICNGIEVTVNTTSVFIEAGSSKVNFKDGLIQFNDGSNNGMVKVTPTATALSSLQNDINELKALYSNMITAMDAAATSSPSVPVKNIDLAAYFTPSTTWAATLLPVTTQADIEDTAITH